MKKHIELSVFAALSDCDQQENRGWGSASRYGHDNQPQERTPNQDDVICMTPPIANQRSASGTTSCLSNQHKDPSMYAMKNSPQIPKRPSNSDSIEKIHVKSPDGQTICLTPMYTAKPVFSADMVQKFRKIVDAKKVNSELNEARGTPSLNSSCSTPGASSQFGDTARRYIARTPSTAPRPVSKNVVPKSAIPLQLSARKVQIDGQTVHVIPNNSSTHMSENSQEEPEGLNNLVIRPDGSQLPDVRTAVLVKTPKGAGATSLLYKEGTRYVSLKENSENPTHVLGVSAKMDSEFSILSPSAPTNSKDNLFGGGGGEKRATNTAAAKDHNYVSTGAADSSNASVASTSDSHQSQLWMRTEKQTGPLTRPPLHRAENANDTAKKSKDKPDDDGAVLMTPPVEDEFLKAKKKKLDEDPKMSIVCENCGNLTRNYRFCAYCNRAIPPEPTWHRRIPDPKKNSNSDSSKSITNPTSATQKVVSKSTFYGNKLKEQSKPYDNLKRKVRSTRGMARGGKRGAKTSFTETVTISSDEDEPDAPTNKSANESQIVASDTPSTSTSQSGSPLMPTVGDSPSPSPSPSAPQPTPHLSRRERMEDKDGNRVFVKKKQSKLVPAQVGLPSVTRVDLEARGIRIGSMKGVPFRPVLISVEAIHVDCETVAESLSLVIHTHEIVGCHAHLGSSMPSLFIYVIPSCGERIRNQCKMTQDGPYFDPTSDEDLHKRFIILFKTMTPSNAKEIKSIFKQVAAKRNVTELFQEISFADANDILLALSTQQKKCSKGKTRTSARPLQANVVSSSSSEYPTPMETDELPPLNIEEHRHAVFTGPVEKLIVYPPPPATGAITVTNEDLFCLNEGEFINDIIIDFYLRYLVHKELSEEEHDKTHIFNSFFYKKLNLKQPDDVPTAPAVLKRHARVKNWTRRVDIFSKDFVIVPINENAHWYLAIICFPGLKAPQFEVHTHPKTQAEVHKQKQACILVMDSLAGPSRQGVIKTLRDYLQVEWDTKKKETDGARVFNKTFVRGSNVKVPQQNNFSDCGVFVLQYVESFFKDPIDDYTFPLSLQQWFPVETATQKRQDIRNLVLALKDEQDANKR